MILSANGFDSLPSAIARHGAGRKVIAFDVFNTLVRRSVEGEWLKRASAFALRRLLEPHVHRWFLPTVESVFERRREIERQIASERVARDEDNEADFELVVRRWVGTWLPVGAEQVIDQCREQELTLEEQALTATPTAREMLEAARSTGARVIFVSDMYLSAAQIQRLLDHCGLGGFFDGGYSSTDVGLRKATGRMFPWLLRKEGIPATQLLFVGDDLEADQHKPGQLGIGTVHVVDEAELTRRGRLQTLESLASRNHVWNLAIVQELMDQLPDGASQKSGSIDYELGQTLAPGLVAYVMETVSLAIRRDARRIFFLAREGLTFLRIYSILQRAGVFGSSPPEVRYLFLSRASTILPSMRALRWDEIHRFWKQYPNQTLRSLLRNLALPEQPFLDLAAAAGLANPDRRLKEPQEDVEFQRFLSSRAVQEQFVAHRDAARQTLRDYLAHRGLWNEQRVVLADIGWKGSMQDNLARAFTKVAGFPELFGSYFALAGAGETHQRSYKHGYMADFRRGDVEELDLFRNTAIYEMVTQAGHGSTVGYERRKENPSALLPVLKEYEIERENTSKYFKVAVKGILDWTRDFTRVFPLSPFSADDLRAGALARALEYIRYPTREQATAFLRYSHVESFGVHEVSRFGFTPNVRDFFKKSPRKAWKELERRFEHTMWREGVLRRSPIPLATFWWDLLVTMRR